MRFEHGLTVGEDEETALMTAVSAVAQKHRGEVLFGSDAVEVKPEDLSNLVTRMQGASVNLESCIISSYRTKSQ